MFKQRAVASTPISVPPEKIFALMADGTTWPDWCSSVDAFRLERTGATDREGPGAIRAFWFRGRTTRSEITEVQPDRLLRYRLLSGLPFWRYVGTGTVTDGVLHWESTFYAKLPWRGGHWRRYMQDFLNDFVRELATYADSSKEGTC
jgi:uncharacterized protein YndB with AHSA1/START domain